MLALYSRGIFTLLLILILASCSTSGSVKNSATENGLIDNPFAGFNSSTKESSKNITFRSKKGDKQTEVEIPQEQNAEFQVPLNSSFQAALEKNQESTAGDGIDRRYSAQKATTADREIASTFGNHEDAVASAKRREIEQGLGLQPSEELPSMDESYLAKVDGIKQLFHSGRLEAALIEIDSLIKTYPTNSRLFEMRGTLLDRLGYSALAMRSWKQALEFEPGKIALKKMIEKREAQRSVASESK